MDYNELYKYIVDMLEKGIKSQNIEERKIILEKMIQYYAEEYEELVKNYCYKKIEEPLLNLLESIKKFSLTDDSEKIKIINNNNCLKRLRTISLQIFELAKKKTLIDKNTYDYYMLQLSNLEKEIPDSLMPVFCFEKSECCLDLQYLLNGDNVECYSLRLNQILK